MSVVRLYAYARRLLTAARQALTPTSGQLIYDTQMKELFVGDGATAGGLPAIPYPLGTNVRIVDAGGYGHYTTIKAACDFVATQTPGSTNRWVIYVAPGIYAEAPFTIPTYTTVIGLGIRASNHSVQIQPATPPTSGSFITLGSASSSSGAGLQDVFVSSATALSLSGDFYLVDCSLPTSTGGQNLARVQIVLAIGALNGFQAYALRTGHSAVQDCRITCTGGTVCAGIKDALIKECMILGTSTYGILCRHSSGGSVVQNSRINSGDTSAAFTTDLYTTAGTMFISSTGYKTSFGTIYDFGKTSFTRLNAAPADADIQANELCFWFDATNGAAKAMFKGKSANGTVVTGSVTLS